jgi:hypothetical protein
MVENGIDITAQDGLSDDLGTTKKVKYFTRPFVAFKARCRVKVKDVESNE